jgi:hypothetical protein
MRDVVAPPMTADLTAESVVGPWRTIRDTADFEESRGGGWWTSLDEMQRTLNP